MPVEDFLSIPKQSEPCLNVDGVEKPFFEVILNPIPYWYVFLFPQYGNPLQEKILKVLITIFSHHSLFWKSVAGVMTGQIILMRKNSGGELAVGQFTIQRK